jgi:hypothetical protein
MTKVEWLKANGYKRSKEDKDIYEKQFKECMLTFCINVYNNYYFLKLDNDPLTELDRRFWSFLGSKFDLLEQDVEKFKECE